MRRKAGKKTNFGEKVSISDNNGFVGVNRISWDHFNEATGLIERAKPYRDKRGYHPARMCAGVIYITVKRKKFCADKVCSHRRVVKNGFLY